MIAILDYGVGNLRSVEKAFTANGGEAVITSDLKILEAAEKLVLPGVGAFGACMKALSESGFDDFLHEAVLIKKTPLLGVCVGMQMLFEESEEFGKVAGLGFLKGRVRRFPESLLTPQVGWNQVRQNGSHQLFNEIESEAFFYFVHSYFCDAETPDNIIGTTEYGENYASVVARENICGVQFHPEKSQAVGLKLLQNFALKF